MRAGAIVVLASLAACSAPSGSLPLISRAPPYAPIEGLETPEILARARGAILSASAEKPIVVTFLPSLERRDHAIRGRVVALAGPTPDGRFAYAVRDERAGLAVHRAHVRGGQQHVARFPRAIAALAIAPDGGHVAILAEYEADDPRSRGGVLRELVTLSLATGETRASGYACWNATPAWIDAERVACVVAAEDGARSIAVVDPRDPSSARVVCAGDAVLRDDAAPDGAPGLLVLRREDDRARFFRVPITGGEPVEVALRGSLQPLGCVGDGLVASFSSPTLGTEPQYEVELLGPWVALATIKLHDIATGAFRTIEPRASPRRSWSAGRLDP